MAITEIQKIFCDVATPYSTALLEAHFSPKNGTSSQIDVLETTGTVIDTIEAGILIAGVIAAPGTAGISLGTAAAIVVLAKTGLAFYEWAKTFSENPSEDRYPLEVQKDVLQHRLRIQLHRALYLFTLRYADTLETVVDKKSLRRFAQQTATRLLKFQLQHEEENPGAILPAEELLDLLLSSAKINLNPTKQADRVFVQNPLSTPGIVKSNVLYSKYLWALPTWYIYDNTGNGEWIGSQNTHSYLKVTTHIEYGVISLPKEKLQLDKLAADLHDYKVLTPKDLGRTPSQLSQNLWVRHHVTCDEMRAYLVWVKQPGISAQSLNDYLSLCYKKSIIACCHDDRFKGFDLQGGCFSNVDFSSADLSDCDLRNTNWSGNYTWLTKTIFNRVIIHQNTHFQDVHAEESIWNDVSFIDGVNLLHAKLTLATLTRCKMDRNTIMQLGTDWLLAKMLDPIIVDKHSEWEKDFQKTLNKAQQERQQLQKQMHHLSHSLEVQTQSLAKKIETNTADTQHIWTTIRKEIDTLKISSSLYPEFVSQLNLLHEQCERIEKSLFSQQTAHAEIENFFQEEEMRWSEQSHTNTLFDQRLSDVENVNNISNRLIHYCREEVDTLHFQFIKTAFVELLCTTPLHSKETSESLTECTDKFISTGKGFFLLHGDPGCGRTTFLKLLYIELIEQLSKVKQTHVGDTNHTLTPVLIPILIDMHEVRDSDRNGLRVALETRLGIAQVDKLIESEHSLVMVDNLDVGNIPLQKFVEDCIALGRQFKHQPKFIFSTKTSYLFSLDRDYHEFFMVADFHLDSERLIQPFNKNQIKQFFSRYHKDDTYQRFLALQIETPEIRSMLQSPLLLSLIIEAFNSTSFNTDKITLRSDFYTEYWHALYKHVVPFLPEDKKDFQSFVDLIQDIAVTIYKKGSDWFEQKRRLTPSARDRSPLGILRGKIEHLSFLLITKKPDVLQMRFLHPSLGHYWVAQKLLNDLDEDDYLSEKALEIWNLHNLRDYPDILGFLIERIQKVKTDYNIDFQERLMAIVMQTANPAQRHSVKASANAMTVRCRLNKYIDRPLDNVQIPYFDGTGISGVGAFIRNACLKGAWLMDAVLLWADMEGSDLNDVRLLKASSFIQIDSELKTFAIYPSLCGMIIAYVVKPESYSQGYQIALTWIKNGQPEKIMSWSAHKRDIYTLVFAVSADEKTVFLASAGEGGTVRIWRFNPLDGSVNILFKLHASKKAPIGVLAWSPDANYLAVGGDDRHVRIWDLQTSRKIYKSKKFPASTIRALIWSQQNQLFAIDDGNILHIWDTPQDPNLSKLECIDLQTVFSQKLTPIQHMALSKDGHSLALTQLNGDVLVLPMEEEKDYRLHMIFRGHKRKVNKVCWADKLLITASDDETGRVWHDPRAHRKLPHGHAVDQLALSTNQQEAILGGSNTHSNLSNGASSRMYFWSIYPLKGEHPSQDILGSVTCISTYMMQNQMHQTVAGYINGAVMLYTLNDQKQITEKLLWEHEGVSVSHVSWSEDGQFIASLCQDGTMVVKDMNHEDRPLLILQVESHEAINHFVWIKTENFTTFFITVDMSGAIRVYDAAGQSFFNMGHMKVPVSPALLKLVDLDISSDPAATYVAILNDQTNPLVTTIAVSRDESVEIWLIDLNKMHGEDTSFVKLFVLPHKNGEAIMLNWSPNGNYLASLDCQRTIYVWNEAYTCLYIYKHASPIHSLVWSDHYLIAGTQNEMLFWDTTQENIWSQSPTTIRVGSPLLNVVNQHFVIADNKAIWVCSRPELFAGQGPKSWVATIKEDLLLHGVKSPKQISESNRELFKQKGANISNHQKFSLFRSRENSDSNMGAAKLPPPVKKAELEQLSLSRQSSLHSLQKGSSDSASGSSPRIRTGSHSPGIIFN